MQKDINILCTCGCGNGFQITFLLNEDEDFAYIDTLASGFYSGQRGIWKTIYNRIKAAWFMLRGKEYHLHEIVLSKEQWKEFVAAANEVIGSG